jgi:hypothetical protein
MNECNLIDTLKEIFRDDPLTKCIVFEDIEVFNKDKKEFEFIFDVINSFEQVSNGFIKVKRYAISKPYFEKITTTFISKSHVDTILDFLQKQNPDINFCESKDYTTQIYFDKIL